MSASEGVPGMPRAAVGQWLFFLSVSACVVLLLATPYYYLALLPGLLIMALLLFGSRPELAYFLLVFLLPFENLVRLSPEYRFLTLTKFLGIALGGIVLLLLVLKRDTAKNLRSNVWPLLLLMLASYAISSVYAEFRLTALNETRRILVSLAFFALTLLFVSRRAFRQTLPSLLIYAVSLNFALYVWEYILGLRLSPLAQPLFPKGLDPGTALPSAYVAMMVFCLPLLAWRLVAARSALAKGVALALLGLNLYGVVYLRARAAAFMTLIALLLVLWELRHRLQPRHLGFLTLGTGLALVATLAFTPTSYWQKFGNLTKPDADLSVGRRITYYIVGWDLFKKDPVFGTGPGTFHQYYALTPYPQRFTETVEGAEVERRAHNTYLETLTGTGLTGLAILIGVIGLALRNFHVARRNFRQAQDDEMYTLTGLYRISFFTYLMTLFLISYVHSKFFWLAVALSQLALRYSRETVAGPGAPPVSPDQPSATRA